MPSLAFSPTGRGLVCGANTRVVLLRSPRLTTETSQYRAVFTRARSLARRMVGRPQPEMLASLRQDDAVSQAERIAALHFVLRARGVPVRDRMSVRREEERRAWLTQQRRERQVLERIRSMTIAEVKARLVVVARDKNDADEDRDRLRIEFDHLMARLRQLSDEADGERLPSGER